MIIDMLKDALFGNWSGYSEWYVSARWIWFYRLKAATCILLGRNQPTCESYDVYAHVMVTVTESGTSTGSDWETIHWFEGLMVGHGVLSNWWYIYYSDSN